MTLSEISMYIQKELEDAGVPEYTQETRIILREILDVDTGMLLAHPELEIPSEKENEIKDIVTRRKKREPLQYILGSWNFMGLDFYVEPEVLIPRPDTEILVECALKELHDGMRILDLCTGTGCVVLSLLNYSNGCTGVGIDISDHAIELAKKNATRLGLDIPEKLSIIKSDLYEKVDGNFDIIVSNPPYIDTAVIATLEAEVKDYEPHLALDGGEDGLDIVRRIVDNAMEYLTPGGFLMMEIGADQGERTCQIMTEAGFTEVECVKDLAGLDRVVKGYNPILKISGIEWNEAKRNVPDEGMLASVVSDFYKNAEKEIEALRNCFSECVTGEEAAIEAYRIKAHSMKHAAALIGAMDLSLEAKKLEFAAKDNDLDLIKLLHEPFCTEYLSLAKELAITFSGGVEAMKGEDFDEQRFFMLVEKIKTAMSELDIAMLNDLFDEVSAMNIPARLNLGVKLLEEAILSLDEDEFTKALQELGVLD